MEISTRTYRVTIFHLIAIQYPNVYTMIDLINFLIMDTITNWKQLKIMLQ